MSIYLIYGLAISVAAILALALFPRQRQIATISGVLAAPFGLLDSLFVVDYWQPEHIFGSLFSIEGILFSFGNGVFVWLLTAALFWRRLENTLDYKIVIRRAIVYSALALTVMVVLWEKGAGITSMSLMTSAIAAMLVVSASMLLQNRAILPISIMGSIGFLSFYAAQLAFLSLVGFDSSAIWKEEVQEGLVLFGYPVEEFCWAVVYGFGWTTSIAYWCDIKIAADH